MSDILCSAASWLGVDWDRCKDFTVAKKIDTPVGAGCGTLEEGRPVDKGEIPFLDAVYDFLDIKEVEIFIKKRLNHAKSRKEGKESIWDETDCLC